MAKMKNYILAKVSNIIPYYPSLNEITGSVTASILMMQLEYWFAKKDGQAFFKFTEPCDHPSYKEGDSWIEELNFGKDEFKGAFNRIGKSYTSKGQFIKHQGEDLFQGKLYASYYDRQKRLTYYFRNNELVDRKINNWISSKQEEPISSKWGKPISSKQGEDTSVNRENISLETGKTDLQRTEKPISTDGNFPFPHISVDYIQETTSVDYIQKTTTDTNDKQSEIVCASDEAHARLSVVIEHWNSYSYLPKIVKLNSNTKRYKMLRARVKDYGLEDVLRAIDNISQSDFLQGKKTGKNGRPFHLTFDWFVAPNNFPKVLEGNYSNKSSNQVIYQGQGCQVEGASGNAFDRLRQRLEEEGR